jgi:hypothetical protein
MLKLAIIIQSADLGDLDLPKPATLYLRLGLIHV